MMLQCTSPDVNNMLWFWRLCSTLLPKEYRKVSAITVSKARPRQYGRAGVLPLLKSTSG